MPPRPASCVLREHMKASTVTHPSNQANAYSAAVQKQPGNLCSNMQIMKKNLQNKQQNMHNLPEYKQNMYNMQDSMQNMKQKGSAKYANLLHILYIAICIICKLEPFTVICIFIYILMMICKPSKSICKTCSQGPLNQYGE